MLDSESVPLCGAIWIQVYFVYLFRYGAEVENYLEVYLKTPGLSKSDVTRALLARGTARKQGGESLLVKADQGTVSPSPTIFLSIFFSLDFQTVLKLDPFNKELQQSLRRQIVGICLINYTLAHLK
jgi:hypothetical protein